MLVSQRVLRSYPHNGLASIMAPGETVTLESGETLTQKQLYLRALTLDGKNK